MPRYLFRVMTLSILCFQVLDDYGVTWADFEAVRLDTFAQEEINGLFIANLQMRVHLDATTLPEVVQVALTEPFLRRLRVELVLGLQEHALVVPDVSLQLVVAGHDVTELTVLMPSLLRLVVHKLVAELEALLLLMTPMVAVCTLSKMVTLTIVVQRGRRRMVETIFMLAHVQISHIDLLDD